MEGMFEGVRSLLNIPDISNWDTSNVNNISSIFRGCFYLRSLPDISVFKTDNITDMSSMFYGCENLTFLPNISNWNTSKVTKMDNLFAGCSTLISFPDFSKWNTSNVTTMGNIFGEFLKIRGETYYGNCGLHFIYKKEKDLPKIISCSNIRILPDISKWDISKVINMEKIQWMLGIKIFAKYIKMEYYKC